MKTKAERMAQKVIGITIAYPILFILICLLGSLIGSEIMGYAAVFCFYLIIPILVINWILSVWSLRLEKKPIGFWALSCTIFYSLIFSGLLYVFTTVKMC
ncbi:hypothetical protein [Chryseobacterium taiwanense]|uniref:Uncharacterized protein n=1 Tax=Chryseobacterium taiwanense TaxID=363331 RepID=A0A0B4CSZ1_9FLAO|nr:hypothetical protein [Chryseobacterium taiwanense]KIC64339.1 hypothetical protein RM51_06435 [Chryseobacterium taiwanense]